MMSKLKEVILMDGEQITFNIEGDAYNDSPNPVAKLVGVIIRVLGQLIGMSQRVYIVKTTNRLLLVSKNVIFWKIPKDTEVRTLSYTAVDSVGYAQAKRWLVFSSLYFQLSLRSGENFRVKYQGTLPELSELVSSMNAALYGGQQTSSDKLAA
ncbi:MAG: hypothetical protein HN353_01310 [Bdellovibrionales bacterium]|nr:hypothetical protein [Bdellovibrionales bacterium]MBT3526693.1 hypothetical protein [Bdellovibrionales bacterium]MBT7668461.1 hypothetical protein [Bdellovibrionales bacterium]MBT7765652.1 hypothetical protein [Bdellovibrionales bacterium]